jgi:rhodanese-related sulfurtransferase
VLLDFRGVEAASKCSINNAIKQYKNTSYINIPLNDEDFIELLNIKTRHLSDNTQFITMCAKGYRSIIGYSLLNLMKMKEWKIKVCRCS